MLWRSRRLPLATRDVLKVLFYWVNDMRQKFQGTNPKYRNLSEAERWREYERRKMELNQAKGWTNDIEYRADIKRICDELGI